MNFLYVLNKLVQIGPPSSETGKNCPSEKRASIFTLKGSGMAQHIGKLKQDKWWIVYLGQLPLQIWCKLIQSAQLWELSRANCCSPNWPEKWVESTSLRSRPRQHYQGLKPIADRPGCRIEKKGKDGQDRTVKTRKRDDCECIATWGSPIHASPFPL